MTVETDGSRETLCVTPALDALESRLNAQVDDLTAVSHGSSNGGGEVGNEHVFVTRTLYVQDGEVTLKPEVSFSTLREFTPRTIRVEIQTGGTDRRCQWPVYVYDEVAYKL